MSLQVMTGRGRAPIRYPGARLPHHLRRERAGLEQPLVLAPPAHPFDRMLLGQYCG